MAVFAGFLAWVHGFVLAYGLWGTFLIAVAESFIFPVPTAVIIAPATSFGVDPLLITIVATVGSVLGAIIGYGLGLKLGRPVAERLFKEHRVKKVEAWFDKYGIWAVFIAAFSPIPFKVFTWAAGIFRVKFVPFVLVSIAGRFLQFAIAAYVGNIFGAGIVEWLGTI